MSRLIPILLLCLFPHTSLALDTDSTLEVQRQRPGVVFGARVITGQLGLRTNSAESDIRLTALPALTIGGDVWPSESLGMFGSLSVGTGAKIAGVLGNKVDYNLALSRIGVRYRWYSGPRSNAVAWGLGFGGRLFYQFVQEQRPSVLIDRMIIGPEARSFVTVPITSSIWIRTGAHIGLPFFVREEPTDTGDPKGFYNVGGHIVSVFHLEGPWSIQVDADYDHRFINFKGIGTRAAGVTQGKTTDRFGTLTVGIRYVPLNE